MMVKRLLRLRNVLVVFVVVMLRHVKRLRRTTRSHGRHLLLVAHPDDESMFFSPTMLNLQGRIDLLCLSNGNKYGMGQTREQEIRGLASHLGIGLTLVRKFEDGEDWYSWAVCAYLLKMHILKPFDVLITFDEKGMSGHKNHISCQKGARHFLKLRREVRGMFLKSRNIFCKYLFDFSSSGVSYVTPLSMYMTPVRLMLFHRSQMVDWFRWLFVSFSNTMTYNDFAVVN